MPDEKEQVTPELEPATGDELDAQTTEGKELDETEADDKDPKAEDETAEDDKEDAQDESDENPKADTKAEKRIAELNRRIKERDELLADAREEIEYYEQKLNEQAQAIEDELPNYIVHTPSGDESVYRLDEKEFKWALKSIRIADGDEIAEKVKVAYEKFQDRIGPIRKRGEEIQQQALEHWKSDWNEVDKQFFEAFPELKPHREKLVKQIQDNINEDPLLVERLKKGTLPKFKYVMKLADQSGLSKQIESKQLKEEQANLAMSRKGTATSAVKTPVFTAKQIGKMSSAEFARHEKEINRQMAKGLIK